MPERYIFRKNRRWYSSPLAVFILTSLIIGGLFITQGFRRGEVKPLFMPTPTATRIADSFNLEAETQFQAGNLDQAITAYEEAITVNPQSGRLHAELARILTYSTKSQTTDTAKQKRYDQALQVSEQATTLLPDDSTVFAIRAFTLDWYASFLRYNLLDAEQATRVLTQAEQAITKAITLDQTNVLAQVYYAEILTDQERYTQAKDAIAAALKKDPNSWEAHRVNGLFLETQGYYEDSIKEYETAHKLVMNLAFMDVQLGTSWRNMALNTANEGLRKQYYDTAIEYFTLARNLNEQQGIQDPIPYLGIGRAYAQEGEFFIASLNMNKALQYKPDDQAVYAQLGMVYRQARNYEDAILALGCAVRGCNADTTFKLRNANPDIDAPIQFKEGMKLGGDTIVYYYTYASLLAGMWQPRDPTRAGYCREAESLIQEIRTSQYGNDPTINSILTESQSICNSPDNALSAATATPNPKGTPTAVRTPTLFPTPKLGQTPTP